MSSEHPSDVGHRIGDVSDLPPELLSQLSIQKLDEVEQAVINTLTSRYNGIATIDEILVGIYRDSGILQTDRRKFSNKLYRMQNARLISSVNGRKGVYCLPSYSTKKSDELTFDL